MNWRTVKSSAVEEPKTIDETSSRAVVYVRKNIQQVTVKDPTTKDSVEMWQYEELIFPKDIWNEIGELAVENSIQADEQSTTIGDLQSLTLDILYQQTFDELDI